ncbi:hypothetical protein SMA90_31820, partial [Escherichia coli]
MGAFRRGLAFGRRSANNDASTPGPALRDPGPCDATVLRREGGVANRPHAQQQGQPDLTNHHSTRFTEEPHAMVKTASTMLPLG